MLSSRVVFLYSSRWRKNCEGRGWSCQSVRLQCLSPQLPPASYCKLHCELLWYQCLAPAVPRTDLTVLLYHCHTVCGALQWATAFPPWAIPKCSHRGQDPFPCSSFYGCGIANTIYSVSIIWIVFIAMYLLYLQSCLKLLNSSPLCRLPPYTIITRDIWDVLAQRRSHQAQTFQGWPTTTFSPPKQLWFYGGYGNCGESCLCGQSLHHPLLRQFAVSPYVEISLPI